MNLVDASVHSPEVSSNNLLLAGLSLVYMSVFKFVNFNSLSDPVNSINANHLVDFRKYNMFNKYFIAFTEHMGIVPLQYEHFVDALRLAEKFLNFPILTGRLPHYAVSKTHKQAYTDHMSLQVYSDDYHKFEQLLSSADRSVSTV